MLDPTREELLAFLEGQYPNLTGEPVHTEAEAESDDHDGCPCRFDIESAAYWLASRYHGGQGSNLYSALSTSEFRPGAASGPEPESTEADLYRVGADWIEGGAA